MPDKLLTLNISGFWLETFMLVHCGSILKSQEQNGMNGTVCTLHHTSPRCHDLLTFPMDKTKSCCSLPHSGLHHPPAVYTELNTLRDGWLKNQPPLLYLCATTQTKSTLMLQSHLCQLASHCQALLSLVSPTGPYTVGRYKQALFTPGK